MNSKTLDEEITLKLRELISLCKRAKVISVNRNVRWREVYYCQFKFRPSKIFK
jgi:hypothetical protein